MKRASPGLFQAFLLGAALAWAPGLRAAQAQDIGLVAPLSDSLSLLGEQMTTGARIAAETLGKAPDDLVIEDDGCTAEGGEEAARDLAEAGVRIVIGFLCTESIEAAMPILAEAGIPVVTPGVRTDSLTDQRHRTGWPVFRTAPRADAEREAAARLLLPLWRDKLFALVDDGTIYGRELTESFRLAAETIGLRPVFVDTFRPQMDNQIGLVGRLRRAGATHVLVGGDREDVAIIGRDAAELDYPLTIAAGEALRAAGSQVPLAPGTLMIAPPEPAEIASSQAHAAFMERGVVPEGYALPAFAAFELADAALRTAAARGVAPQEALSAARFSTAMGEIAFDAKGDLSQNPYRLYRHDGDTFIEME